MACEKCHTYCIWICFFGFLYLLFIAILVATESTTIRSDIADRKTTTVSLFVSAVIYAVGFILLFCLKYFKSRRQASSSLKRWMDRNPRARKFMELGEMQVSDHGPSEGRNSHVLAE